MKADRQVNGLEKLEDQEGHGQVEAGDGSAQKVSYSGRKHFSEKEEGNASETDGVPDHVDDEAEKGHPLEFGLHLVVHGFGVAEEEEEGSDAGHGDGHHDAWDEEQDSSSGSVDDKDRHWKKVSMF